MCVGDRWFKTVAAEGEEAFCLCRGCVSCECVSLKSRELPFTNSTKASRELVRKKCFFFVVLERLGNWTRQCCFVLEACG